MSLSLSEMTAPHLSLDELETARKGRGLAGIEVVIGASDDVAGVKARLVGSRANVTALRVEAWDHANALEVARLAAFLEVPISTPRSAVDDLGALAASFHEVGAKLLVGQGSKLDEMVETVDEIRRVDPSNALGIAWEVRPSSESLEEAGAVLFACLPILGLVRLHGGGPEQRDQDGTGVGSLLVDLALSTYSSGIVLCPSSPETLDEWRQWLASKKIAGCGSKTQVGGVELDMREVEPRDRLDTILGAYRSLGRGATLRLTVDHDPSCMYHTLEATEAEGSFSFRRLKDGPTVWKAEVTKL